jgi:thioredoxin 1
VSISLVTQLGPDDFDGFITGTQPVLVDFWAEGCPPCLPLATAIAELAQKYAGRFCFGAVDAVRHRALAERYSVASVPTVIIFCNGEPVRRLVGGRPQRHLARELMEAEVL